MNCGEWISKRAWIHPDDMILKDGNEVLTNREFNRRVNRVGRVLQTLGVAKGDRICGLMDNSSEFLAILFAAAKTGAIMMPVNGRLAVPELAFIVGDSRPRVVFHAAEFSGKAEQLRAAVGTEAAFVSVGDGETPLFDRALEPPLGNISDAEPVSVESVTADDPFLLLYTSGTTGTPKGAILTHGNILFGAIHSLLGYGVNRSYRALIAAPLFHIGGLAGAFMPAVYSGGSVILARELNPLELLDLIVREQVNYLFSVPVMFALMTQARAWPRADLSRVKFFIAGGAALDPALVRKYRDEKGVSFVQGYGMTETGRITALDLEETIRKAGSVGKEVFHLHLRLVDEHDRDVDPGSVGEIVVRGPNVFQGYWNRPEETARAFRNGWFHTGDLARRDEEGFLFIEGRKVDLIIVGGENVYPAEVELAIQALPPVREAVVVGKPSSSKGEIVVAFVSLKPGSSLAKMELVKALEGRIADFKIPREIHFIDDFPRNSIGKIVKKDLLATVAGKKPAP